MNVLKREKSVNVLKEWWLAVKEVEWMLKLMKWKNGEKWNECWSGSVIENEKMCVEMLKDVKSVKCKRIMMER